MIDCRKVSAGTGCTLTVVGSEEEILEAAAAHAVARHGCQDGPRLREMMRAKLEDVRLDGEASNDGHVGAGQARLTGNAAVQPLTTRQRELLRLVAAGLDNIAIARQLGLSPGTVRKHLENAFTRLGVSSRTAAIAKLHPELIWP
jgi:DNA-binding NarL/FixJ family response regulator